MVSRVPDRLARRVATLAVLALCLFPSCEKVPLLAPTASIITILSSRDVLPINGTAQIIATVIEQSGTPTHNGTLVTFTTTLGTLEPQEAVTSNGQATVTLRAGTQSGTAEVSAFSGSARSESPVMVTIGGAAAASISLTASPGTVPAGGGTVTLSARPTDANANLLPGVPVSFSADAGTLSSSSAISDSLGEARISLTTDRDTQVTASVGAQTATVTIRVSVLPTVTIAATGGAPTVGELTPFAVSVSVGTNPIRQVSVDFGDGTSQSLGSLTGSTNVTHTYSFAGTFNVVATATDTSGGVVSVATVLVVEGAAPLNVTIVASPTTVQVGDAVAFTATVTQAVGTLEIDRYEWSFGDGGSAVTTGNATSRVYSGAGRRVVEVTAVEKDGRIGTGRVEVDVTPRSPLNVNVTATPSPATVDEVVTFTATASGTTVPIDRYEWDFGDGTTATVIVVRYDWDFGDGTTSTTTGRTTTHAYSALSGSGTKTVTVTAVAFDGTTVSMQGLLTVRDTP